jgi:hypothetical protein
MVVSLAYMQPNTIADNINSMCSDLYGIIVILYHDFPGVISCTCAYMTCIAAIDLCDLLWYISDAYWGYTHSSHFPVPYLIHVFIRCCLCSAGSIRSREDGEMCYTVFLPHSQIPYVLHIYFTVTVVMDELIVFRRDL